MASVVVLVSNSGSLSLGTIPVLNQVMSAATGATHAFSGIGRHVNSSLKKIGAKNIEAGIGRGVGFGHGLPVKPGIFHNIQLYILEAMTKMMIKFGVARNLSIGQVLPPSVQSGMSVVHGYSSQDPLGSIAQFGKKMPGVMNEGQARDRRTNLGIRNFTSEERPLNLSVSTRTEKVINNFLQDPALRGENVEPHERDEQLQSENRVLEMVIKHQQIIEKLMEENERLHKILVEDLKVPPSKLQATCPGKK